MLKKIDKRIIIPAIKNIMLVILGTAVLAFGTALFIVPFELVSGGVSGIAIIINHIFKAEWLNIDLIVTVLTWIFFWLGFLILGKKFAAKTLLSTIVYPVFFSFFNWLSSPDVLNGYFHLLSNENDQVSMMLAAVVGGAAVGVGCAITFLGGGSTGGVDVLAFLICRIFPKIKSSVAMFAVDASIVVLGVFIIDNMVKSILGIISAFIVAFFVEKVFIGGTASFVAHIVSNEYEEISRGVIEKLDRTATIMDAVGAYSGAPKKLIMVSFSMEQYTELMKIINTADPDAFVSINRAHEINGEGWTKEKTTKE